MTRSSLTLLLAVGSVLCTAFGGVHDAVVMLQLGSREDPSEADLFQQFDADGSNSLQQQELSVYLASIGRKATPAATARVMRLADKDFSWSLTPEEFEECTTTGSCTLQGAEEEAVAAQAAAAAAHVAPLLTADEKVALGPEELVVPGVQASVEESEVESPEMGLAGTTEAVAEEAVEDQEAAYVGNLEGSVAAPSADNAIEGVSEDHAGDGESAETPAAEQGAASTSQNIFDRMHEVLKTQGPEWVQQAGAVFRFVVEDLGLIYTLDLKNGNGKLSPGVTGKADCTLTIADADMLALAQGKLDLTTAISGGKLSIKGSTKLADKLFKVLQTVQFQ